MYWVETWIFCSSFISEGKKLRVKAVKVEVNTAASRQKVAGLSFLFCEVCTVYSTHASAGVFSFVHKDQRQARSSTLETFPHFQQAWMTQMHNLTYSLNETLLFPTDVFFQLDYSLCNYGYMLWTFHCGRNCSFVMSGRHLFIFSKNYKCVQSVILIVHCNIDNETLKQSTDDMSLMHLSLFRIIPQNKLHSNQ